MANVALMNSMSGISQRSAWQLSWVKKWPSFKKAKTVLEVGAGSFETLAHLASLYPDKQFYGVDFVLRTSALEVADHAPANLNVLKHDVRDLSLFNENHFDFVFSVALVEHVRELDAHLKEVYRVLREGGYYCFTTSPVWSSSLGHHCDHNSPDCSIPLYGHLYMTRAQLGQFIVDERNKTREESERILKRVYDRQDLSRLSRSEVQRIVDESPFRVVSWREGKDTNYSKKFVAAVLQNNQYGLKEADLKVSSIVCSLKKDKARQEQTSSCFAWLKRILPGRKI